MSMDIAKKLILGDGLLRELNFVVVTAEEAMDRGGGGFKKPPPPPRKPRPRRESRLLVGWEPFLLVAKREF